MIDELFFYIFSNAFIKLLLLIVGYSFINITIIIKIIKQKNCNTILFNSFIYINILI